MKILIVYHSGLSKEALGFYQEYINQGVALDVIVPSKIAIEKTYSASGYLEYRDAHKNQPYTIIPVDLRKPNSYGEGFKFFQLYQAIKQSKPDIIHVFDEYSSFYLSQVILCRNIIYGRKVPVLCYASQNIAFKNPSLIFVFSLRFFKRIAYKIAFPLMLVFHRKYLDGATGCNSEALNIMKNLGATFPTRLTFWGINFDIFYPQDILVCREKFNLQKEIKLVGYVGRLDAEKGVDTLVRAIARIPEYHVLIAGEGKDKVVIDALIENLGIKERVHRISNITRKELAMLYNCFDVLVVPSKTIANWKEQYGRVLVEAMGCHIPIVGSSSGAIPEVLAGYPNHMIFQENDPQDLSNKIKKVQDLKVPQYFNFDDYLQRFSVKTFIASYISFYKLILEHGKNNE